MHFFSDVQIERNEATPQGKEAKQAEVIGFLFIITVCFVIGIVIVLDIPTYKANLQRLMNNLMNGNKVRRSPRKAPKKAKTPRKGKWKKEGNIRKRRNERPDQNAQFEMEVLE